MLKTNFSKAAVRFHHANPAILSNEGHPNMGSPDSIRHQLVSLKLAAALLLYVESGNLGQVLQAPCNVMLSKEFIIQPDIVFIAKGRTGLIEKTSLPGIT